MEKHLPAPHPQPANPPAASVFPQDVRHQLAIGAMARLQDAIEQDGVGVISEDPGEGEECQGASNFWSPC